MQHDLLTRACVIKVCCKRLCCQFECEHTKLTWFDLLKKERKILMQILKNLKVVYVEKFDDLWIRTCCALDNCIHILHALIDADLHNCELLGEELHYIQSCHMFLLDKLFPSLKIITCVNGKK